MKAIDHHLYNRNQYLYYRCTLPRNLHSILDTREIRISLGTQDTTLARLYVAKLDVEVENLLNQIYSSLENSSDTQDIDRIQKMIVSGSEAIKLKAGLPQRQRLSFDHLVCRSGGGRERLFSYVCEEYLKDCVTNSSKTIAHKRQTYLIFQSICGDISFDDVSKVNARQFKSVMLKCPPNLTKTQEVASYLEVDWNNLPDKTPQSLVTVNSRLVAMTSLFVWAERNDLYEGKNPFSGLMIKKADTKANKRLPFSSSMLMCLFSSPLYKGCKGSSLTERFEVGTLLIKDHKYWIPLIGLYTGMRLNEICQLLTDDIQCIDGVWVIDIDEGEGKKLKTISSRRRVPIHDFLIKQGLLDYIQEQGSGRVFKALPSDGNGSYSYKFSKEFAIILKALNLKQAGICFHSFRHTFIDGLRNAGVEKAIAMKLVGHHSTNDIHSGYGYGHSLEVLQEQINKLSFPI